MTWVQFSLRPLTPFLASRFSSGCWGHCCCGSGAQAVDVLSTLDNIVVDDTFYVTFDGTSGGLVDSHDLAAAFTEAFNSLPLPEGSPSIIAATAVGEIPLESGIAVEFTVSSNPSGISEQVLDSSNLAQIIQSISDSLSGSGAQAVDVLTTLDGVVVPETFYVTFDGTSSGLVDSHDLGTIFTEAVNSLPLPAGSPQVVGAIAVGEIPLESGIAVEFSVSSNPSGISEQVLDASNLGEIIQSITDSLSGSGAQAVDVLSTLDNIVVDDTFYVTFDGTGGGLVDSHDLGTIFTEAFSSLPLPAGSPAIVEVIAVDEIALGSGSIAVEFAVSSSPAGISEQVLDASNLVQIIQSISDSLSGSGVQALDVLSTLDNVVVDDTFYVTFDGVGGGLVNSHDLGTIFTDAFNSLSLPEGSPTIIETTTVGVIPLGSGSIAVEFSVSSTPSSISDQILEETNLDQVLQSISDSLNGNGAQAVDVLTTLDGVVENDTLPLIPSLCQQVLLALLELLLLMKSLWRVALQLSFP
ncbi:expressed unknown protein [Seminavis robusta]|uniref:Uncharacterized protein n=1 Tax=Seminavis robusta TaxID=568900 RepID=A0A9N8DAV2_9STRA|nr:expressed unknown protein [Seminavis robusta]|eukprot:Sro14_g010740.1 n/a (524) ;mRNA; f:137975-139743